MTDIEKAIEKAKRIERLVLYVLAVVLLAVLIAYARTAFDDARRDAENSNQTDGAACAKEDPA